MGNRVVRPGAGRLGSASFVLQDNVMNMRDYVFLGLAALAALAFYCNGFYVGVYRSWKSLKAPAPGEGAEGAGSLAGAPRGCTVIALFNFQVEPRLRRSDQPEPADLRNN